MKQLALSMMLLLMSSIVWSANCNQLSVSLINQASTNELDTYAQEAYACDRGPLLAAAGDRYFDLKKWNKSAQAYEAALSWFNYRSHTPKFSKYRVALYQRESPLVS